MVCFSVQLIVPFEISQNQQLIEWLLQFLDHILHVRRSGPRFILLLFLSNLNHLINPKAVIFAAEIVVEDFAVKDLIPKIECRTVQRSRRACFTIELIVPFYLLLSSSLFPRSVRDVYLQIWEKNAMYFERL